MTQSQTDLGTLRADAEAFFRSYGLSFSDGLNALLKDAMQHGKVSLLIDQEQEDGYIAEWEAHDPFFNRATQAELRRRARNMDAGINCSVREILEVQ
jgi:hypothetical protein